MGLDQILNFRKQHFFPGGIFRAGRFNFIMAFNSLSIIICAIKIVIVYFKKISCLIFNCVCILFYCPNVLIFCLHLRIFICICKFYPRLEYLHKESSELEGSKFLKQYGVQIFFLLKRHRFSPRMNRKDA